MAKALLGKTDARIKILKKFFRYDDACGVCLYCWNEAEARYDLCDGPCEGDCQCQSPSASLYRLMTVSGYDGNGNLEIPCAPGGTNPIELPILAYIELLLKYRLVLRLAIGFGALSAALLGAVAYLMLR